MAAASNIDRKTASKILGVSIRTIDRYIRGGKLFANVDNGRIWLDKKEIMNMKNPAQVIPVKTIDNRQPTLSAHSSPKAKIVDNDFYRDLYEEAKRALSDYQQKLEQSNYRIGQLESQILHPTTAPKVIDHRDDSGLSIELLRKDLAEKEKELEATKELARREKGSRIALSILTYILLGALPLVWYLLRQGF